MFFERTTENFVQTKDLSNLMNYRPINTKVRVIEKTFQFFSDVNSIILAKTTNLPGINLAVPRCG